MGNCIKLAHENKSSHEFIDVLFFPDAGMPCKSSIKNEFCTNKRCKMNHSETSLLRFLRHLQGAKRTLDICVFTITCDQIADEVLAAHGRGVAVRVITDDRQSTTLGSDIQKFTDAGIAVRDDNAHTHMHHKFCIIDKKLLLNGSFNWSRQAVIGNNENVVVCVGQIVDQFQEHFEKLWQKFQS